MTDRYIEKKATTLAEAWTNLEPKLPLPPGSKFYFRRSPTPFARLRRTLLHEHYEPPKYFLSGHRGSGKSTELNRIADDQKLSEKYVVSCFRISTMCDVNNIGYADVLWALAAKLFESYSQILDNLNKKVDPDLENKITTWRNSVKTHERVSTSNLSVDWEANIGNWFGKLVPRFRRDRIVRDTLKIVFERQTSDIIEIINAIGDEILLETDRYPLLLVDDLDRPSRPAAQLLFQDYLDVLTEPQVAVVYTIPVSLYYTGRTAQDLRDARFAVPNIRLNRRGYPLGARWEPENLEPKNFKQFRDLAYLRMDSSLIDVEALDEAIRVCGGVVRHFVWILRRAVELAEDSDEKKVLRSHVDWAVDQLSNDFRRILRTEESYELLTAVRKSRDLRGPDLLLDLLHDQAVLEYENGSVWCDVHPAVDRILEPAT